MRNFKRKKCMKKRTKKWINMEIKKDWERRKDYEDENDQQTKIKREHTHNRRAQGVRMKCKRRLSECPKKCSEVYWMGNCYRRKVYEDENNKNNM